LLQKEREERMALMPDEHFEGDFLEVQKNNHEITNGVQVRFSADSIPRAV
jgi:hypothetical protein